MQPPLFTYEPADKDSNHSEKGFGAYRVPRPFAVFRPLPLQRVYIDPKSPQAAELAKRKATLRVEPEEPKKREIPLNEPDEQDIYRWIMILAKLSYEVAYGFRPVSVLERLLAPELYEVLKLIVPLERRYDLGVEQSLNELRRLEAKRREQLNQRKNRSGGKTNKETPRGRQHKKLSMDEELALQAAEVRKCVDQSCRKFGLDLSAPTRSFLQRATPDVSPDQVTVAQIDQREGKRPARRIPFFRIFPINGKVNKVDDPDRKTYAFEGYVLVRVGDRVRAFTAKIRPHRRSFQAVAVEIG